VEGDVHRWATLFAEDWQVSYAYHSKPWEAGHDPMRVLQQGGHLVPSSSWYHVYGAAARHVLELDNPFIPVVEGSDGEGSDGIGCGGEESLGDVWAVEPQEAEAIETADSAVGPSIATWTLETGCGPEPGLDQASGPVLLVDSNVGPTPLESNLRVGTIERCIGPSQNTETASGPDDCSGLRPGVEKASGPEATHNSVQT